MTLTLSPPSMSTVFPLYHTSMWVTIVTLAIALLSSTWAMETPPNRLYGVSPHDTARYQQCDTVQCPSLSPSSPAPHRIPIDRVNDNYCDCADGRDEPGTSACAGRSHALFYCRNTGSRPQEIPTSRVNDGICDCCDGTDEYASDLVHCPNTCAAQGAAQRSYWQSRRQAVVAGLESRRRYARDGARRAAEIGRELTSIRKELKTAKEERDVLGAEKDRIEHLEGLKEKEEELSQEEKEDDQNQNEDHRDGEEDEREEEESPDRNNQVPPEPSPGILSLMYSVYRTVYRSLFSLYVDLVRSFYGEFNKTEAEKIRDRYDESEKRVKELEQKEKDLDQKKQQDWGPDNRFGVLSEKCFTIDTAEYVYEMCPYGKAAQKPKKGSDVNLGKFDGFKDNYSKMIFNNGAKCWNGPRRSLTVMLECDQQEQVRSMLEPSMCVYEMKFTTPAACEPSQLEEIDNELKFLEK
eukprot:gb/GECH01006821.1/.p1 GENE.gb/GECH01006821.1/~~gb/GECH01006821.1/.p1  ORF type:complete len:465 (+),score=101.56 gb/GECH01006821.1/:1-1395(+)